MDKDVTVKGVGRTVVVRSGDGEIAEKLPVDAAGRARIVDEIDIGAFERQ